MIKWLTIRLRARRINNIALSRLRAQYMKHLKPTDDNEQQAPDLCAQFEMRRRKLTARDVKSVRQARKLGADWQGLREELEHTRIYRILGWDYEEISQ